jgi:hypothetical protein
MRRLMRRPDRYLRRPSHRGLAWQTVRFTYYAPGSIATFEPNAVANRPELSERGFEVERAR